MHRNAGTTNDQSKATGADGAALTNGILEEFRSEFRSDPVNALVQNALGKTSLPEIAENRRVVSITDHTFSHLLDDWPVTNQKASGRCWIFSGLNLLRSQAMKKMNLKEFEFSQNYVMFWDKMERANYFLEAIIDTRELPVDDRTVSFLLTAPMGDGGQWNMGTSRNRQFRTGFPPILIQNVSML